MAQSEPEAPDRARSGRRPGAPAKAPSKLDRALARVCLNCPACRKARKAQTGAAFWLVRKVEGAVCPFCRAYERVYGRKSHEALLH